MVKLPRQGIRFYRAQLDSGNVWQLCGHFPGRLPHPADQGSGNVAAAISAELLTLKNEHFEFCF